MNKLAAGVLGGAVGTTALNLMTYLDIAVRGRPPSELPAKVVEKLASTAGLNLAGEGPDNRKARNRRSGLGALLGYATGLGLGLVYGAARRQVRLPPIAAAAILGLGAMAMSDVPITLLRLTDPRTWGLTDWVSDIVPHLAYGAATALAFEGLAGVSSPSGEGS